VPELPEVETIRRDLARLIVGRKILGVTTDSAKQVRPSLGVVRKAVVGKTIKEVRRRAKILQIFLSGGGILIVHLKLTGRLLFRKAADPKDDYQHVVVGLSGGRQLRFCDLRKFGWVRLVTGQELRNISQELGPEPLGDLDLGIFRNLLGSTRRSVKIVLMDQKKMAGVGNIYANDALFLARIDPRRPANGLKPKEAKVLFGAVGKVLRAGIKYRGASDQHYLDALGQKGAYQEHFLVYGRTGKKCFGCSGKVRRIKIGGRGTFYCPSCQK
jgi:formamidopyrimidine-DNA glycosylase